MYYGEYECSIRTNTTDLGATNQ